MYKLFIYLSIYVFTINFVDLGVRITQRLYQGTKNYFSNHHKVLYDSFLLSMGGFVKKIGVGFI